MLMPCMLHIHKHKVYVPSVVWKWAPGSTADTILTGEQALVPMFFSGEGQRAPLPFAQYVLIQGRAPWS